jgi:hypothetical protein
METTTAARMASASASASAVSTAATAATAAMLCEGRAGRAKAETDGKRNDRKKFCKA